ncbi:Solute carrier family 2, facilitated glucose transporter member 1 [Hypsibius exemplaris]|uniref:Solute carrier family 2, facilitated glucose transporter member 1 n=1 Tax=Hypsibius exemplaris TaxID=2072580 RepID=A0A1W0XDT2_HYPEX|nr:Solute carrier family 2, facilitated glucose transporter member 1 [Hypsibius exemplaris]
MKTSAERINSSASSELLRGPSSELLREPSSELLRGPSSELLREPSSELLREPSSELLRGPNGHHHHTTISMEKVPAERLTWQLLLVVFSASFGAWFPIGYTYGVTNPIQNIVLQWIRTVQCERYGVPAVIPDAELSNNTDNGNLVLRAEHPSELWCKLIPEEEESKMLDFNPELNTIWALTGAAIASGAFISLWSTGWWLSHFGSKQTLIYNNCIGLLGAVLTGMCVMVHSYELLIAGRFILGFNIGIAVSVVPLFCTEISPPNLRGTMGTVPGVMLVFGQFFAVVLGLPQLLGTADLWPIISWMRLLPCFVLFITIPFCPESPRYLLLQRKDKVAARKALVWLRGTDDVQAELTVIQKEGDVMSDDNKTVSVVGIFRDPFLRKAMVVCMVAIFSQQLSGIGPVTAYTNAIFLAAGLGKLEALYGTTGLFALQVASVFLSMILLDRAGRRSLLLIGLVGSTVCVFSFLGFSLAGNYGGYQWTTYANLGCVLAFIVVFNLGPAFIPWVLVGEMFSSSSRGAAMTLMSAGCHGVLAINTFLFPILQTFIGDWTFAIFGVCLVLGTTYLYTHLIETKGKQLDQIQTELRQKLR